MTRRWRTLQVVTFNAWVGQPRAQLRDNLARLVRDTNPDVLCVQECKRWAVRVPGYRRVAPTRLAATRRGFPWPEARSTVLYVRRKGVRVVRRGARQVDGPDWTYEGVTKPPHVWPAVTLVANGSAWDVLGVHRVPGGIRGHNRPTWRAEHRELVRYAETRPAGRPMVLLGDWNARVTELIAQHLLADTSTDTTPTRASLVGIDGALVRGARANGVHKRLESYGSDHRPVAMRLVR